MISIILLSIVAIILILALIYEYGEKTEIESLKKIREKLEKIVQKCCT